MGQGKITSLANKVLRQYSVFPSWVGGWLVVMQETSSFINFLIYTITSRILWDTNPNIHPWFLHSYWLFLMAVVPMYLFLGLMWYKFITPAKHKYQQHQAFREERSPAMKKLVEIEKKIDEVLKRRDD